MTKYSSGWPVPVLRHSKTQHGSAATAELIQGMTGAITTLAQHAVGGASVGDTIMRAPPNPSGEHGHDHSGGYFGRSLYRTIATYDFDPGDHYVTAVLGSDVTTRLICAAAGANETNESEAVQVIAPWIPPCPLNGGAYTRMSISFSVEYDHDFNGAMVSGDAVNLIVRPRHQAYSGLSIDAARISIGTVTSTADRRVKSGTTSRLEYLRPGAINPMAISLEAVRGGTSGARGPAVKLLCVEIGVFE